MLYFLYTEQSPALRAGIKRIAKESLKDQPLDTFNFVKFDGNNSLVQEVVDECNSMALGYDKKVVSFENCYFLLKEKGKNKLEGDQDYKCFINYLKNPNEDTDLIISVNSLDINEKSEIVSILKEKAKVIASKESTDAEWKAFVKGYFKDKLHVEIDNDAAIEVADRTVMDQELFINTAKKLALYTDHIKYEDVVLMVSRPLDDQTYLMSNLLLEKKNAQALALFRDLCVNKVEPVTIISLLANQFRLLSQISYLIKQGKSVDDIAKELNIKSGRVYAISKQVPLIGAKKLNEVIDDLYYLDLQIKSGAVDRFYAFELFILKFKTR